MMSREEILSKLKELQELHNSDFAPGWNDMASETIDEILTAEEDDTFRFWVS